MESERLTTAIQLYNQLEELLAKVAGRADFLQNAILWLSVITSGALWLLVGQALPHTALWVGAIISTFVTGITLYLYASGINRKRSTAIFLHREISAFLAAIRSTPDMSDKEFWDTYKDLETRIRTLSFQLDA